VVHRQEVPTLLREECERTDRNGESQASASFLPVFQKVHSVVGNSQTATLYSKTKAFSPAVEDLPSVNSLTEPIVPPTYIVDLLPRPASASDSNIKKGGRPFGSHDLLWLRSRHPTGSPVEPTSNNSGSRPGRMAACRGHSEERLLMRSGPLKAA